MTVWKERLVLAVIAFAAGTGVTLQVVAAKHALKQPGKTSLDVVKLQNDLLAMCVAQNEDLLSRVQVQNEIRMCTVTECRRAWKKETLCR